MVDKQTYQNLLDEVPDHVKLIAVSKTKPVSDIQELYDLGQRDFGENKVQELLLKMDMLPDDIKWHLIGPLQKNKVNKVLGKIELIHSVDSLPLAEKINQRAESIGLKQNVLLQVNISEEESKSGFKKEQIKTEFKSLIKLKHLNIQGFMTIAAHTNDESVIRKNFKELKYLRNELSKNFILSLKTLSMGMTSDYNLAIEEETTMVRVGSLIFGKRVTVNL